VVSALGKLAHIKSRWIYLLTFAVVLFAILVPIALPVPVQPQTRKAFAEVNALRPGSSVFIWTTYGAGATAELNPMLDDLLYNLMQRGANIVLAPGDADDLQIAWTEMQKEAAFFPAYAKGYGTRWVETGFNPSPTVALREATTSIATAYDNVDFHGHPLSGLPLIQQDPALTARSYALGVNIDAGGDYVNWINLVGQPQGLPPLVGVIQLEAPLAATYVNTGQIGAIIPGANGAAQYEVLLKRPAGAVRTQNTASLAALLVVVLLILGNLGHLAERRRKAV
jgi:hypothetical protein